MEIKFNNHTPEIFAIANNNVSFHRLAFDNQTIDRSNVPSEVFLTKESDGNTEVRSMAWHPSFEHRDVIALGHSTGRVGLLATTASQNPSLIGTNSNITEYHPKHSRPCTALSWNPLSPHVLAIGLEKSRPGSLILWDINTKSDFSQHSSDKSKISSELNPSPNLQSLAKPLIETASNETVNSLLWLNQETLLVGFSKKHLRVYDIRASSSCTNSVINQKATSGLCLDPTKEDRFACFGDSTLAIWDSRMLTKPVTTFETPQPVAKIEWCSTRSGMLGVLFAGDNPRYVPGRKKMNVYDMMNATYTDQEMQVGGYQPISRTVHPKIPDSEWVVGFAWLPPFGSHLPSLKSTILTTSNTASFTITTVPESTSLCWRGKGGFAMASEYTTTLFEHRDSVESTADEQPPPPPPSDLASLLHQRVLNGYGLDEENVLSNIALSLEPGNSSLHNLWRWIDRVKKVLHPKPLSRPATNPHNSPGNWSRSRSHRPSALKTKKLPFFDGIQTILKDANEGDQPLSVSETVPWIGVANTKSKIFAGGKRNMALTMCDWGGADGRGEANRFGRNSIGEELVRRLQKSGSTERACAIAVWHLDVKLAIEILNLSLKIKGQTKYSAVAMAMSGYTGSNCPTLWLDTCRQLQSELESAYLQMAFAFLIACADDSKDASDCARKFDVILFNKSILLEDRVAFACMYLPDTALITYINTLAVELIKEGSLEGAMVVGLATKHGIDLLQNYVDKTGDVQTCLLAVVQICSNSLSSNAHIQHWRDSYRNLLNKWQLYFERVSFDQLWNKLCAVEQPSAQVYLHCNYCNKSITHSQQQKLPSSLGGVRAPCGDECAGDRKAVRTRAVSSPSREVSNRLFNHRFPPGSRSVTFRDQVRSRQLSDPCRSFSTNKGFPGRGYGGAIASQGPITGCPSCHKPLPRCSVCSMHMGTRPDETDYRKWITWCMKCRHGGHFAHTKEWFELHRRCPVTDCKCFCNDDLPVS